MAGVLDMMTGSLTATATFARRGWVYVPCDPCDYADHRIGTLTLLMQGSTRPGAKVTPHHYAVQEEDGHGVDGLRRFLLCKEASGEIYEVDAYIGIVRCGCKAAKCKLGCKHADAVRDLLDTGAL